MSFSDDSQADIANQFTFRCGIFCINPMLNASINFYLHWKIPRLQPTGLFFTRIQLISLLKRVIFPSYKMVQ